MALSAAPMSVLGLLLPEWMILGAARIIIGVAGALALTRLFGGMLFQVELADPAVFRALGTMLLAVGAVATLVPACVRRRSIPPSRSGASSSVVSLSNARVR